MADIIVDDGLLVAYADNQLDSEQRELVEKALQKSESLRLKLNKFKTTGAMLRANLDAGQEVIPDHIKHRILMLDQRIKKERVKRSSESEDIIRIDGFLELPALSEDIFRIDGFLELPAFLSRISSEDTNAYSYSEVWEIEDSAEQPIVVQNDIEITNFGSIVQNDRFSIIWVSPVDGDFSVFEMITDDRKLLFSGKASAGSLINVPPIIIVSDQVELKLEIDVRNKNKKKIVTQNITLKIISLQENNEKWAQGFTELLAYKNEFGDCLPPSGYKTSSGFNLHSWVGEQRTSFKSNRLDKEQIGKLEKLGFDWIA